MKVSKTAWIVIAIAGVSALAVGGYFLHKTNKEKELANTRNALNAELERLKKEKELSKGSYADLAEKKENEATKGGVVFR